MEQTLRQIPGPAEQPWSLHFFERGEDLLRQLRRETFDLLILDWQLPDISGIALLRWTREHMESPPAVIMLTSRDAESGDTYGRCEVGRAAAKDSSPPRLASTGRP